MFQFLFQKLFSDTYHNNDSELFSESFMIDSFKWNLDDNYLSEMEKLIKSKQPELLEILKTNKDKQIIVAPGVFLTAYDYDHLSTAAKFSAKALKTLKKVVDNQIVVLTIIISIVNR